MIRSLSIAFALCVIVIAMLGGTQTATHDTTRIAIQVSDAGPATWSQAVNVAGNLREQYGEKAQIEIIAFGNGVPMLQSYSPVKERIAALASAGTSSFACETAMHLRKLEHADMLPDVRFLKSGAAEIVERQRRGWIVIRP